ncbi:hypothetical protein [Dyadobacter sp. LHD-138]|uniref:hypothetical protein n=1 Tax=Dyadobacter sp. LHD-138 TaxID=3071413 RepID=UPI0027E103AE|nr:hypothetical protein [Dyadobacter sp. LHD-138]MDQ6479992.1 hypothetical protein [Dyadobacter sp. LHD-138]
MELFNKVYSLLIGLGNDSDFAKIIVDQIASDEVIFYKGGEMKTSSTVQIYIDRYNYARNSSKLGKFERFDHFISQLKQWKEPALYYCNISDLSKNETIIIFLSVRHDEVVAIMKNNKVSPESLASGISNRSENYTRLKKLIPITLSS